MDERETRKRQRGDADGLSAEVRQRAARRRRARSERRRTAWFGLGMFGIVGWSVAVPTLLGIAAGAWLDRRYPGETSWTLTLLIAGVILGCLNAWYWIREESNGD